MMKRFVILVITLAVIAVALGWAGYLPGMRQAPPAASQSLNLPPQPLNGADQTTFLNLVCAKASGPAGGYAHQCASLPGYPSSDYGGAGLGLGLTLQNVVYGHLTSATADEAYVTYEGSFEPHASNYGGGILFTKAGDGWKLKGWYPGGQAESCVLLTSTGRAQFVCLNSWQGQGETDDVLIQQTLPPPQNGQGILLRARDLRDTLNPNANCQGLQQGQNVLLGINSLTATSGGAEARISYVSAQAAQAACHASQFAAAPLTSATLALKWNGTHLTTSPALNFATSP